MRYIFILALIFFFVKGLSQDLVGKVINSDSIPIPYSLISWGNKDRGIYSNENGVFKLDSLSSDTLLFSALGYETLLMSSYGLAGNDTTLIVLKNSAIPLPKILVLSKKYRLFKKRMKKKHFTSLGFCVNEDKYSSLHGTSFLNNKKGVFSSVGVFINKKGDKKNSNTILRLRIFTLNSNGVPDDDILKTNIILPNKRGWIMIDIKHLDIQIPNSGYLVAVETIYTSSEIETVCADNPYIGLTTIERGCDMKSWVKHKNSNWHPFSIGSTDKTILAPFFRVHLLIED